MRFGISGQTYDISREDVISSSIGIAPRPFDGRSKYFVELHGQKYPIKQLIHLTTGLPYTGPFGAQDAQRILEKLGFKIRIINEPVTAETVHYVGKSKNKDDGVMKFAITLEQDEDRFIVASCPALPGCHSQGKNEEEATTNIREAIRGYVASLKRHNEPIPQITEVREIEVAI
jgi:antitoxin HicB